MEGKKNKLMPILTLNRTKSIGCIHCSDGFSYPQKFTACFLEQLGVYFITEYSPECANGRRYDFYLPDTNFIIEVDGGIGHGKKTFDNKQDLIGDKVDQLKDDIVLKELGLTVVRVPADISTLEYMKNSISKVFDGIFFMDFINWEKCEKYALKSLVIKVCDLFSEGLNVKDIAEKVIYQNIL